jgi:purine-nucleoside phosphorylase
MTPHISAKKEQIAKTVLMPGDPLRAKWIAETFLKDAILVNDVRNMFAYTGTYKGKKITVMGHGMGIPSIGIYSYELFKFYDVENIIRVGSAGTYSPKINVMDVVLAKTAYSSSKYPEEIGIKYNNGVVESSSKINKVIEGKSKELKINIHQVQVHSSDTFYNISTPEQNRKNTGSEVVEMEAVALFSNAIKLNKHAACLLTISDSLIDLSQSISHDKRRESFKEMVTLALESAILL